MSLLFSTVKFLFNVSHPKNIKLNSTQKLVLLCLTYHTGKNKDTWISREQLANECSIKITQVKVNLAYLSVNNLITISKFCTKRGKQNRYQINTAVLEKLNILEQIDQKVDHKINNISPPAHLENRIPMGGKPPIVGGTMGGKPPMGASQNLSQLSVFNNKNQEKNSLNVTIKTNLENNYIDQTDKDEQIMSKKNLSENTKRFDDFWDVYPRKVAKEEARKKWAKNKLDENADEIIGHIEKLKQTEWREREIKFIPHATTFINQKRWNDEIYANDERSSLNEENIRNRPLTYRQAATETMWNRLANW